MVGLTGNVGNITCLTPSVAAWPLVSMRLSDAF